MPYFTDYDDLIERLINLLDRLADIQHTYQWWFNSRHGMPHQDHDHIHNHVVIDYGDFTRFTFKFNEDSDLPDEIKLKCYEAYLCVF